MNAPTATTTIAALAADWQTYKRIEDEAKAKRIEVEELLCEELRGPTEGTVSEKTDAVKVSISYKLNRTVDTKALQTAWNNLPAFVQAAFNWKADVSLTLLRKLQEDHPALYEQAAQFVTAKPAKPSVKVETL